MVTKLTGRSNALTRGRGKKVGLKRKTVAPSSVPKVVSGYTKSGTTTTGFGLTSGDSFLRTTTTSKKKKR